MRLNYHRYRCIIKRKDLAQKAFRFFTYLFNLLFQQFRKNIDLWVHLCGKEELQIV